MLLEQAKDVNTTIPLAGKMMSDQKEEGRKGSSVTRVTNHGEKKRETVVIYHFGKQTGKKGQE